MTTTYEITTTHHDNGRTHYDVFPTTEEAKRHYRYLANHLLAQYGEGYQLRVWDIAGGQTTHASPPGDIDLAFDPAGGIRVGEFEIEDKETLGCAVHVEVRRLADPAPAPINVPELPQLPQLPPFVDEPPPEARAPMNTVATYAELAAMPWTEVPIIREERDEGRIVPEIDVSPRAIREHRVNAFVPKRGLGQMLGNMLVIDAKCYNGFTVRHMIPINAIMRVVTLHGKKVQIGVRGGLPRDFVFTDDECAFVFQHEVEMQLYWAARA